MRLERKDAWNAANFLRAMFMHYDPALRIEMRCLMPVHERERPMYRPRFWYEFDQAPLMAEETATLAIVEEWDVFFGVLPRQGGKGCAEDLVQGRVLWSDIDGEGEGPQAASDRLERALEENNLPGPHFVVVSGGGVHAYWLLGETVDLTTDEARDQYRKVLKRLAIATTGDEASAEPNRILRLPGTLNHKLPGQPREVYLARVAGNAPAYEFGYWRAKLPPLPIPKWEFAGGTRGQAKMTLALQGGRFQPQKSLPPTTRKLLESGSPAGQRHRDAVKVAFSAMHSGFDPDETLMLLQTFKASSGWDPDPNELEQIVEYAGRRV